MYLNIFPVLLVGGGLVTFLYFLLVAQAEILVQAVDDIVDVLRWKIRRKEGDCNPDCKKQSAENTKILENRFHWLRGAFD